MQGAGARRARNLTERQSERANKTPAAADSRAAPAPPSSEKVGPPTRAQPPGTRPESMTNELAEWQRRSLASPRLAWIYCGRRDDASSRTRARVVGGGSMRGRAPARRRGVAPAHGEEFRWAMAMRSRPSEPDSSCACAESGRPRLAPPGLAAGVCGLPVVTLPPRGYKRCAVGLVVRCRREPRGIPLTRAPPPDWQTESSEAQAHQSPLTSQCKPWRAGAARGGCTQVPGSESSLRFFRKGKGNRVSRDRN